MEKQRVTAQPLRACTPKGALDALDGVIQIAGYSFLWKVVCGRYRSI
jgi:hypothetical protein